MAVVLVLASCTATRAPTTPTSTPAPTPAVVSPSPSAVAAKYVFPVAGKADYGHTHHDYPATDIFAACGTRVVSPVDGVILETSRVDRWDPKVNDGATRGGLNISLRGDDGVRYYGAHFSAIEAAIQPGARVTAGQPMALLGRTGDASACHVHFGISPPCMGEADWWVRRGVIWPWPYLDAWRAGQARSPADEIATWQLNNGCPDHPAPGA